jgi:hypothetical protein
MGRRGVRWVESGLSGSFLGARDFVRAGSRYPRGCQRRRGGGSAQPRRRRGLAGLAVGPSPSIHPRISGYLLIQPQPRSRAVLYRPVLDGVLGNICSIRRLPETLPPNRQCNHEFHSSAPRPRASPARSEVLKFWYHLLLPIREHRKAGLSKTPESSSVGRVKDREETGSTKGISTVQS